MVKFAFGPDDSSCLTKPVYYLLCLICSSALPNVHNIFTASVIMKQNHISLANMTLGP